MNNKPKKARTLKALTKTQQTPVKTAEKVVKTVQYQTVDKRSSGQRLDNYLRRFLEVPKSRLYQMIRKGEVRINQKRAKAESRVQTGDIVRIPPVSVEEKGKRFIPDSQIKLIKDAIIFQNQNFMVINKPAGIAVHAGSRQALGIIDIVQAAFPDAGWSLCHRLDKDTSGCLVLANSRDALHAFQQASQAGEIQKAYLTLVKGHWQANQLLIDIPLDKKYHDEESRYERVGAGEATALSIFTTREFYKKSTLMEVMIKTGRTHQIRVHAQLSDHPVAMDEKYGDFAWNRALLQLGLKRMFLHAHWIRFYALGEWIHVSADLPEDLEHFLQTSA